ncbi:MAG: fluoride efflux transporter CrcB [Bacteroidia bacterium]|nr:fluoride efflux transporter CrcB [Bacteroidia bacterium]
MLKSVLLVALGGSVGSILRYLASVFTTKFYSANFPLATFIVNIIGCLIIGLLFGLFEKNGIVNDNLRLLLITGFCGGFTTFSAFSSENINLLQNGNFMTAFVYISLSVILGLFAVWLGLFIAKV